SWRLFEQSDLRHARNLAVLMCDVQHTAQTRKRSVNHRWSRGLCLTLAHERSRCVCRQPQSRHVLTVRVKLRKTDNRFRSVLPRLKRLIAALGVVEDKRSSQVIVSDLLEVLPTWRAPLAVAHESAQLCERFLLHVFLRAHTHWLAVLIELR